MLESRPDVFELRREPVEPNVVLLPEVRLGLLGEGEEVLGVALSGVLRFP